MESPSTIQAHSHPVYLSEKLYYVAYQPDKRRSHTAQFKGLYSLVSLGIDHHCLYSCTVDQLLAVLRPRRCRFIRHLWGNKRIHTRCYIDDMEGSHARREIIQVINLHPIRRPLCKVDMFSVDYGYRKGAEYSIETE